MIRHLGIFFALLAVVGMTACGADPTVRSISLTPTSAALKVGETVQFNALATYQKGDHPPSNQDITSSVTWTVANPSVAKISTSGLLTALGIGSTTVTASITDGGSTTNATASIVVSASTSGGGEGGVRVLSSITITPNAQTLTSAGQTVQFTAMGTYSSGSPATVDLTDQVAWSSSVPGVATISTSGIATAVSNGTTTISAKMIDALNSNNVVTSTAAITVSGISGGGGGGRVLSSITVTPASQTLTNTASTAQFTAIGNYSSTPTTVNITSSVMWSSSSVGVATINASGLATAVGNGTTVITASMTDPVTGNFHVSTPVALAASGIGNRQLSSVAILPATQTLTNLGQIAQLIAIGSYTTGTPTASDLTNNVAWTSSDPSVVTIASTGTATAVGDGTATIIAKGTSSDGSVVTSSAAITVQSGGVVSGDLTSITITPSAQALTVVGQTAQLLATGNYSGQPAKQDLTPTATWTSSNAGVATISSGGLVRAMGDGTTTITASSTSPVTHAFISSTATITVAGTGVSNGNRSLQSIAITPNSQTVGAPKITTQFFAIGTYTGGLPTTQDLTVNGATWTSSVPSVATIGANTGLVTATGKGVTTITASYTDSLTGNVVTATATLSVEQVTARAITSLTVIPPRQLLHVTGETAQFIAIGNYSSGAPLMEDVTSSVQWISSDDTVATIGDHTGLATATSTQTVAPNQTTITALYDDPVSGKITGSALVEFDGTTPQILPLLTVYIVVGGSGTISMLPLPISCGNTTSGLVPVQTCLASVPYGTTVKLTPAADLGSKFQGWSSNCLPADPDDPPDTCKLPVFGNAGVGAIFTLP